MAIIQRQIKDSMKTITKPIAVCISDIHYNLTNLKLADVALRQAIAKSNELQVPLWICGDLHDTKANIRGECLNALIKTLMLAHRRPMILIGNHDRINEKSEEHSLSVLEGAYAQIVDSISRTNNGTYFIPYHHDPDALRSRLMGIPINSTLIMHQGITGSNMGDYVLDKAAIRPEDVSGHRVISGHYHARQTIELPNGGKWDYIGSPYTMSYGEANDPEKGFQILMDDGSLEFVPTNLRKHRVASIAAHAITLGYPLTKHSLDDLVWVKVSGTKEELMFISKSIIASKINITDFRLDLIPTDTVSTAPNSPATLSNPELLDSLIDSLSNTSIERKERLKGLWKSLA